MCGIYGIFDWHKCNLLLYVILYKESATLTCLLLAVLKLTHFDEYHEIGDEDGAQDNGEEKEPRGRNRFWNRGNHGGAGDGDGRDPNRDPFESVLLAYVVIGMIGFSFILLTYCYALQTRRSRGLNMYTVWRIFFLTFTVILNVWLGILWGKSGRYYTWLLGVSCESFFGGIALISVICARNYGGFEDNCAGGTGGPGGDNDVEIAAPNRRGLFTSVATLTEDLPPSYDEAVVGSGSHSSTTNPNVIARNQWTVQPG